MCTAANFSEVVNPAMHLHWLYMLYFWVLAFVGLFLIVSVMVAYFEVSVHPRGLVEQRGAAHDR